MIAALLTLYRWLFVWHNCECCGKRGDDVRQRFEVEWLCDECMHALYAEGSD